MPVRCLLILSLLFSACSLFAQHPFADSLDREIQKAEPDTHKVALLNKQSVYWSDYDQDKAMQYATQALQLAEEIGDDWGAARAYMNMGLAYGGSGNFISEISQHSKAKLMFLAEGDTLFAAKAVANQAVAEYRLGDYLSSTAHCLEAIDYNRRVNYEWGVAVCQMTLGNVYLDQKNYPESMRCYREAMAINQRTEKNPAFDAQLYVNIGNVYNLEEKNDSALYYYRSVLDIMKEMSGYTYSVLLNNMGTIFRDKEQYDSAHYYFTESLDIRLALGDTDGICSVYQNIGNNYGDLGKTDSALYYLNAALEIANKIHARSQVSAIYQGLASVYAKAGDYTRAYAFQSKYILLNDSLIGAENTAAVNALRENFDAARREQQIRELEATNKFHEERSVRNIILFVAAILVALSFVALLYYRNRARQLANTRLEKQNAEITMQKKAITDSINYAKRIQDSILPPENIVKNILPESFIFYAPKDVVSGDFYWVEQRDDISIFAAVDCTGHGVPGALMSVVGFNLLNQAVNELRLTVPSEILQHLDHGVNKLLRQSETNNSVKDGMDLALCALHTKTNVLHYAGVFNPLYVVSNGVLREVRADKHPIGINVDGITDNYTNNTLQLHPGDMVYLFTDGFADQFGGPMGKKYKYKQLREFLVEISALPVAEQHDKINAEFATWKGALEQVDDVLIMGVRIRQ
jgi:serine phosphatase RsbU (regulator of sigma subunit)